MLRSYRPSVLSIIALIILLPLFFIPGGAIDLLNAKAFIITLGVVVGGLYFLFQVWKGKELLFTKHHILTAAAFLPLVYLLSALLATPSSLSLLGYNMEVGTFGSILLGAALLALSSVVFSDPSRALQSMMALFGSFSALLLFAVVKILSKGAWLTWGNFGGNMGNPLGAWTDLAMAAGLVAVVAILMLGMLAVKGLFKILLYVMALVATVLLVVIHFAPALALTLAASILLVFYFLKIEHYFHPAKGDKPAELPSLFSKKTVLPMILGVASLIFLVNPTFSETADGKVTLGQVVSSAFGVNNADVHPTLSTTLSISKAVLTQSALFGSGPNTFTQDWLIFKPTQVNATPFWAVEFPFGAGFIPTQIAATGIVGTLVWLAFLIFLIALALKVITNIPESRALRFTLISSLAVSLFLWSAFFLYTPSLAVLTLAFIFTGVLLASAGATGVVTSSVLSLKESTPRFVSTLVIAVGCVGLLALGWQEVEKTIAAYHFNQAARLSTVEGTPLADIEVELGKAITHAPLDTYYLALSNMNFSKAQIIANSATGTPEEVKANFEAALGTSIQAARAAVNANPAAYGNWVALGSLYSSLVAKPLEVDGAYENAQFAFNEAYKRNPANPGIPLLLAQLEINKENLDNARSYIRNSIALKEDYADAYLLLARLEASAKNIPAAIASTEKLAALSPDNAGIYFELGVLKYSNADYEGALVALQQALTISPDYANAQYYGALTLVKLGRVEEAKAILESLLAANPDSAELKAAIEELSKKK